MNKAYNKITWQNKPSTATPLNQTNLNEMSNALDTIDDRVIALDSGKVGSVTITNTLQTGDTIATITVDGTATNIKSAQVEVDDTPSATSENPLQNKAIYEMLNNLLPEETAEGNPIAISDASGLNAKYCSVDLLPIQDLHGYDSPWVGGAGKNKLQNTATTATVNGVTFTVNSDGSVRANGTASGNAIFVINSFAFDGTSVILNGCPSGGSGSTYKLDAFGSSGLSEDIGNGVTISASGERNVRIVVFSGTTIDKVFYPMIRLASVTDGTFAPYENICPITGRDSVEVKRTGKNRLENTATSITSNGITFTVNADGSVTCNGTATANTNLYVNGNSVKYFGNTIFNGCPSGGTSTTYFMEYYDTNVPTGYRDYGAGVTIPAETNGHTCRAVILIRNGTTVNNLTFKPMIRLATETDDTYEPYQGSAVTEQLGQTVYGGTLDVKNGKLTIDTGYITFDGTESWTITGAGSAVRTISDMKSVAGSSKSGICSKLETDFGVNGCAQFGSNQGGNQFFIINARDYYGLDTVEKIQAFTNGMQIAYPLATPIEITLTAEQISLLKGQNVISTDGDNIILKYSADIGLYVAGQLQNS